MEGKGEMSSQITGNLITFTGQPAPEAANPVVPASGGFGVVQVAARESVLVTGMGGVSGSEGSEVKKKRGRPRKYAPDGSLNLALSPTPISSSIPLDYSAWKPGRGRAVGAAKKSQKIEFDNPVAGERVSHSLGASFMPHIITVNAGEDIMMKVMSFSQQASRAVCVLSANGTISNVTLQQSTSSGGTLTYEGPFELLSLSGSYMPSENGGTRSISGGMSVSLAGPDGRVVGGGLAGLLVAAGPVQVVLGSFLHGHQHGQMPKKQRIECTQSITTPTIVHTIYSEELKGTYGGTNPVPVPSSFQGNNITSLNPMHNIKDSSADNNGSMHDDESSPDSDQM